MGFAALIGLIGLIGIPALIIIYILKPKYQERKISSTYIWKLSLKYRKRKIPLQWLKSLLLLVQCLIVVILALLLSKPYLARGVNSYAYEKVVIIDASASMMTSDGTSTRFDRAIKEACDIADTAAEGKEMTVILASDSADIVIGDVEECGEQVPSYIKGKLKELKCKGTTANYGLAITEANKVLERNSNAGITLITDHNFQQEGYINVINVAKDEWNFAIDDAWEDIEDDETSKNFGETVLYMNLTSYNKDINVVPCARITYKKSTTSLTNTDADYISATVKLNPVALTANTMAQVKFPYEQIRAAMNKRLSSYKSIEFYCEDVDGSVIADGFSDDDKYFVYGGENTNYKVLLVGESTFYTYNAVQSIGFCDVEQLKPSETPAALATKISGYDLYIYENYVPTTLPVDGAIWMINPPAGNYTEKLGFTVASPVSSVLTGAVINEKTASDPVMYNIKVVDGPQPGTRGVFSYTKYTESSISAKYLKSLVTTPSGAPLIFSGTTDKRINLTVFSFDLSYTDFPLVFQNFPIMIQNMLGDSVSRTIVGYLYEIGDKTTINTMPNAKAVSVSVGEGENLETKEYIDNEVVSSIEYVMQRGGVYTITQTLANVDGTESTKSTSFFVRCNSDESNFNLLGGILVGDEYNPTNDTSARKEVRDYIFKYFAAALILLLLIEWGLQYREQY